MNYRRMDEVDISVVAALYMDYYNAYEDGEWTKETTYKRIHQVWSREDSCCLVLENGGAMIGFAMGYMEQYDDLVAYDLVEIVVEKAYQGKVLEQNFCWSWNGKLKSWVLPWCSSSR